MGTSLSAGTFCLRWIAVNMHTALKARRDASSVPTTTHAPPGLCFMTMSEYEPDEATVSFA